MKRTILNIRRDLRRVSGALATMVWLALAIAITFTAAVPAGAQSPDRTGTITGRVTEIGTALPITGAQVVVAGTTLGTQSDDAGQFVLRNVPAGIVRLEIRRIGYQPQLRPDVAVGSGRAVDVVVQMARALVELQSVEVRPAAFPALPPIGRAVSTSRFTAEEVRRAPGVQEDVVRAVSVLPGVGVTSAARNDLVVRGGAPFENLFVVDNIEVPNINHFGTQGSTGGPLSLINIAFVQEAELSAGGFGVRNGDRASSVTTLTLREGSREAFGSELNVSATGASAIVEGPIGKRGSFLAGARRSYLDFVFAAAGLSFIPAYADGTIKAVYRPTARDQLSFLAIGAQGNVTFNNDDEDGRYDNARVTAPEQLQYFSGLTWTRRLSRGTVTTTLGRTWTRFETVQNDSLDPPQPVFVANTTEGETSLRTDVTTLLSDRVTVDAGVIGKFASALDYRVLLPGFARTDAAGAPRPLDADTSFTAARGGAYAQGTWSLTPTLRATLGVRGDHYAFLNGATRVAPRATVSWQTSERTALSVAAGRYWQAPPLIWLVGDARNASQLSPFRADQVVLSARATPREDTKLQVEAYIKRYADYPARVFRPVAVLQPSGFDDINTDIPFGLEPLASEATGEVVGIEGLAQKTLSAVPVYGLISVSLNRSRFQSLSGSAVPGAFDVPVIANALLGWRPNARWELSGRVRAASGLLTTPFVTSGPNAGQLDFDRYNAGGRLPVFAALDVRIDRRFQFARSQLITYLDVQNATGRANVSRLQWDSRSQRVEQNTSIGVLPSIGVNWTF